MSYAAFAVIVIGGLGIGAWLIIEGHPWFGLLVIIIVSGAKLRASKSDESDG